MYVHRCTQKTCNFHNRLHMPVLRLVVCTNTTQHNTTSADPSVCAVLPLVMAREQVTVEGGLQGSRDGGGNRVTRTDYKLTLGNARKA